MIAPVLPPAVRAASPDVQREYHWTLEFERVLVGQLTKALQATVAGAEEGDAATRSYREMLPATMADALVDAGGTGLSSDLVRSLRTERP